MQRLAILSAVAVSGRSYSYYVEAAPVMAFGRRSGLLWCKNEAILLNLPNSYCQIYKWNQIYQACETNLIHLPVASFVATLRFK